MGVLVTNHPPPTRQKTKQSRCHLQLTHPLRRRKTETAATCRESPGLVFLRDARREHVTQNSKHVPKLANTMVNKLPSLFPWRRNKTKVAAVAIAAPAMDEGEAPYLIIFELSEKTVASGGRPVFSFPFFSRMSRADAHFRRLARIFRPAVLFYPVFERSALIAASSSLSK